MQYKISRDVDSKLLVLKVFPNQDRQNQYLLNTLVSIQFKNDDEYHNSVVANTTIGHDMDGAETKALPKIDEVFDVDLRLFFEVGFDEKL